MQWFLWGDQFYIYSSRYITDNSYKMETEVVSSFFPQTLEQTTKRNLSEDFLDLVDELNDSLESFQLPATVHCAYNPTVYARATLEMYIKRYCNKKKPIMYFGMNPGPWGMSQTGVPFGEIDSVKNWLQIEGPVNKPPQEIPTRPVNGFACPRTEISGKRFWGLFKALCGTPDKFFQSSFVYNYLPQQWLKKNGCNLTPQDFKISEMKHLYSLCDPIFKKVIDLYEIEKIIAVGKFCEARAQQVLKKYSYPSTIQVLYLPHPSPRTVNNNDWDKKATVFLETHNLLKYYK